MSSLTDSDESGAGAARAARGERPPSREPAGWERPTLAALARRHPRITAGTLAALILLVTVTILTTVSNPRRQPLTDAANCSQWAAATTAQQIAYGHLYIDEYGRVANTARNAAAVRTAVDAACTHASYLGEAADISILAALRHAF